MVVRLPKLLYFLDFRALYIIQFIFSTHRYIYLPGRHHQYAMRPSLGNCIILLELYVHIQIYIFFYSILLPFPSIIPDLCALTKKISDNALSLIFQMANE